MLIQTVNLAQADQRLERRFHAIAICRDIENCLNGKDSRSVLAEKVDGGDRPNVELLNRCSHIA